MVSLTALVGVVTLGLTLFVVASLMRQLGAGEAAKGLLILTALVFVGVIAFTYVPAIIAGI